MTNTINKLGYYSHELHHHPESMPQAVIIIDWGLPLQVVRKTGTMPDILVEAIDEFFQKVENSQAA